MTMSGKTWPCTAEFREWIHWTTSVLVSRLSSTSMTSGMLSSSLSGLVLSHSSISTKYFSRPFMGLVNPSYWLL